MYPVCLVLTDPSGSFASMTRVLTLPALAAGATFRTRGSIVASIVPLLWKTTSW
ncbi:MAG: hypothetical protein ABID71_02460 [Chloroflexota bacterium]